MHLRSEYDMDTILGNNVQSIDFLLLEDVDLQILTVSYVEQISDLFGIEYYRI